MVGEKKCDGDALKMKNQHSADSAVPFIRHSNDFRRTFTLTNFTHKPFNHERTYSAFLTPHQKDQHLKMYTVNITESTIRPYTVFCETSF